MTKQTKHITLSPPTGAAFTSNDEHLFREGTHYRLYEKLGAHPAVRDGVQGVSFALWAPNAESVTVIGDFNGWDYGTHPLTKRQDSTGIWQGFISGLKKSDLYKYHLIGADGKGVDKIDPLGQSFEISPKSATVVWEDDYQWSDDEWMATRHKRNGLDSPVSVYEVHLGSWRRNPLEGFRSLTYRELAVELTDYLLETGFTHVEFMPVMEHPFFGSWGYQVTGYFAPTSRYGTPEDFKFLIDTLHQNGIGVYLDWVPSHFPTDEHALSNFDGTCLYEHEDDRRGFHPEWKSAIYNYGRPEVAEFLISNALFWLDYFHIDGLRVDAVASMLYLDYAREEGEWLPNKYGGKENIEAMEFLKKLNTAAYQHFPDIQIIAEESTDWPLVSRPCYTGGLGFGMKWNMGWMHDTLKYFSKDPVYRKYVHDKLTFSIWYAFNENFMLPLSHDEVVYGKGSMIGKMSGDQWQKFANLRALYGYMYAHPGKKLLFMGMEIGQSEEWNHDASLSWHILENPLNAGLKRWVSDLNRLYKRERALFELDFVQSGFEWVDCRDWEDSTLSFLRLSKDGEKILVVCNFTPVERNGFLVGVDEGDIWNELLNSDATIYGGSGAGNMGSVTATKNTTHDRDFSLELTLPPLSTIMLKKA